MYVSTLWAAWITMLPSGTSTFFPSISSSTMMVNGPLACVPLDRSRPARRERRAAVDVAMKCLLPPALRGMSFVLCEHLVGQGRRPCVPANEAPLVLNVIFELVPI